MHAKTITVGVPSYLFTFARFLRLGKPAIVLRSIPFTLDSEGMRIRRDRFASAEIEKVIVLHKKNDTTPLLLIRIKDRNVRFRIKKGSVPILEEWGREVGVPVETIEEPSR